MRVAISCRLRIWSSLQAAQPNDKPMEMSCVISAAGFTVVNRASDKKSQQQQPVRVQKSIELKLDIQITQCFLPSVAAAAHHVISRLFYKNRLRIVFWT